MHSGELSPEELAELEALDAELASSPAGSQGSLDVDPRQSLSDFFDSWDLFADAVWTGTLAGLLLGLVGVYVVQRRMVFLAAAVSQTASLGVVLTFFLPAVLGVDLFLGSPLLGAFVVTALAVLFVATGRAARSAHRDALLGLVFLVGAAGTLTLGTRIVQDIADVKTLLLGTAVAVRPEDFTAMAVVAGVLVPLHAWWYRGFAAVSFDRVGALVRRLPVRLLETTLWLSVAAAIAVSTRVLGALPTFAFSVLPAMAALRVAPNIRSALVIAAALGALSAFLGYLLAFLWSLPVGATQTLTVAAITTLVWILRELRPGRRARQP